MVGRSSRESSSGLRLGQRPDNHSGFCILYVLGQQPIYTHKTDNVEIPHHQQRQRLMKYSGTPSSLTGIERRWTSSGRVLWWIVWWQVKEIPNNIYKYKRESDSSDKKS